MARAPQTGEDVYLSKLYLHGLPPGGDGGGGGGGGGAPISLCVRFSLASRDEEEMYDLSLQVSWWVGLAVARARDSGRSALKTPSRQARGAQTAGGAARR